MLIHILICHLLFSLEILSWSYFKFTKLYSEYAPFNYPVVFLIWVCGSPMGCPPDHYTVVLGSWAPLNFKGRWFGGSSLSCRSLKVRWEMSGSNSPLFHPEEVLGSEFPPSCGLMHQRWGLWQDHFLVSFSHSDMVFFSCAYCVVFSQPTTKVFCLFVWLVWVCFVLFSL